MSEQKAVELLRSRLAKFEIRISEQQALQLLVLCRAQGWKFTAHDADNDMIRATENVKFAEGSDPHTVELLWKKLWDAA